MLALRKLWTVIVGAWVAAFLAGGLLDWILGLQGTWVAVAVLLAGVLGGFLSIGEARRVEPMDPAERRDTILGWGTIVGVVAALACLYLPMPWAIVAALGVLAVTLIALRQVPPPPGQRAR
jgi:hypothetical protein